MKKTEQDVCETLCIHKEISDDVKEKMTDSTTLLMISELFKMLGDHTRIRILHALKQSELCVCDLSYVLDMSQSAISHQLRLLRGARIVKYRKEGKNVYYSIDDQHIFSLLNEGSAHVKE